MEPTNTTVDTHCRDDEPFWGKHPVQWGFRMLEPDARVAFEAFSPGECRAVAAFLNLATPTEGAQDGIAARLAAAVAAQRETMAATDVKSVLDNNLALLKRGLVLDDVDVEIIAFRAMLQLHPGFEALAGKYFGVCASFVFCRKLASLFGMPSQTVSAALAPSSRLVKNGIVEPPNGAGPLYRRLHVMPGLICALMTPADSSDDLLARILPPKHDAHLDLSAYPHLAHETELLSSYLRTALDGQAHGVNILLYGRPGVGKTELAAALAASVRKALYVADPAPDEQESLTPRDRIRDLVQLQKLVYAIDRGIVLVDEAEDLFPTGWSDPAKVPSKAAVNECLEANRTPTVWISNRTEHMDEAFLRRFDLVIKVPPLPTHAKCQLLRGSLPPDTLGDRELRRFASRRELTPAMITRMARVAASGKPRDPTVVRTRLQVISSHYLRTLGTDIADSFSRSPPLQYDPALLNTAPSLDAVLGRLDAQAFTGCMLLHGSPGTGKTAFARVVAEKLDRPLLPRKASSLLSAWVGATEHNLRDMFDEARQEGGVLLLDEAGSFLRDRASASARWEATQTNELLTQMEGFDGVFICTTNRLDDLDPAALRRFDFKVEFRPLRHNQRVDLVRHCCVALGIAVDSRESDLDASVRRLDGLTPGDAAAVLRRLSVSGERPTFDGLLDALTTECCYKTAVHRPIGFLQ